ncbi:cob(I)yrinic acid a,c-diamide adenosyltransferase [Flavilitoribacter nigricans]|uniref:Corrinoid adenosyltransferase n=1 Tax=Flavilitoribacter nigricans (strain ATCC 23147 / DSM 23189 / NBRC 102662 / NCIMB 1420 / SS-2) TaxID=1122177 RepID=A0A2D0N5Y1_FLAN2|nr:cob(I)yrinic acid a,c-diamide adenosyltransferase [Flavilitoribacter nigricans]PHN03800.1 ATP:cob(I)alamin adenosyltransferase [Flavilitoribacter nigricans DSM 23189 = NBRC 102662]
MAFKIYTKTGDLGETGLFGGRRLSKSHLRIDAYGTVDELNSHLGLVRDQQQDEATREILHTIQSKLFSIGSILASDPDKQLPVPELEESDVEALETAMDEMDAQLPELKNFILPGGHPQVSQCHITRCVCRRAERLVVALAAMESVPAIVIKYLNRLSDYLFLLARWTAKELEVPEVIWKRK